MRLGEPEARPEGPLGRALHGQALLRLGKVEEVMLDSAPGRIAYAVLSFGGFLGLGDKLFAVPWNALRFDPQTDAFVLNADKTFLENAPGFDKNNWPDMTNSTWRTNVYSYYRTAPYWE